METAGTLPITAVARILRISRPLALRLVREGGLPSVRTEHGLRVESATLAEWVDGRIQGAAAPSLAKEATKR